jgi:hypothetical protein
MEIDSDAGVFKAGDPAHTMITESGSGQFGPCLADFKVGDVIGQINTTDRNIRQFVEKLCHYSVSSASASSAGMNDAAFYWPSRPAQYGRTRLNATPNHRPQRSLLL